MLSSRPTAKKPAWQACPIASIDCQPGGLLAYAGVRLAHHERAADGHPFGTRETAGGHVLQHRQPYAPDPRRAILLARFQAAGTRGAAAADGAARVRSHGQVGPIRAGTKARDV
jgi:hypothetical protein